MHTKCLVQGRLQVGRVPSLFGCFKVSICNFLKKFIIKAPVWKHRSGKQTLSQYNLLNLSSGNTLQPLLHQTLMSFRASMAQFIPSNSHFIESVLCYPLTQKEIFNEPPLRARHCSGHLGDRFEQVRQDRCPQGSCVQGWRHRL